MSDPPTMSDPLGSFNLSEVLVIPPTEIGHLLLEDTELILKVLKLRHQNSLFSILPTKNLPHLVGLENLLSEYFTNQNIQKEAPLTSPLGASTTDGQSYPDCTISHTRLHWWDALLKPPHTLGG